MAKTRGFRLGRRLVKVFSRFVYRRVRTSGNYLQLGPSNCAARAMSKICSWGRSLRHGATKGLCFGKRISGYIRVGQEPPSFEESSKQQPVSVPKGHLAVYVGEKDDDACRVLVPVIYFNHPLFAELLREAETVYGFNHSGGIQIPCQKSRFENVKMRIAAAAANGGGISRGRRSWK